MIKYDFSVTITREQLETQLDPTDVVEIWDIHDLLSAMDQDDVRQFATEECDILSFTDEELRILSKLVSAVRIIAGGKTEVIDKLHEKLGVLP
jgi:hypothetical protein